MGAKFAAGAGAIARKAPKEAEELAKTVGEDAASEGVGRGVDALDTGEESDDDDNDDPSQSTTDTAAPEIDVDDPVQ